jgi:2-iminobutanoate/2-iminopropanoate deaminase
MKRILHTDQAPAAIGPYSQAVAWGSTVYVSGQIALDPATGQLDNASLEHEVRRVLRNLNAVLEAAGCGPQDVLKCTVFLLDMADFALVNALYADFFTENPPARETVAVAGLPRGARVEISAVAAVPLSAQ